MNLSEITGYLQIPFHGKKGESAYDIAVKYGYEGTEEEWLNSLGFIPDKSIGEEKLSDAMVGKLREYDAFIGSVFEEIHEYKEPAVNEYREVADYVVSYRLMGVAGTYKIKIPKIGAAVTVFDESDETLWSTEMGDYRFSKIDVSDFVGKTVKIYGVANSTPAYPCAFFVDESGNILERMGTDANTVYGYSIMAEYTGNYTFTDAIDAVIPERAKYIYISGRRFTSGGTVTCDAVCRIEVLRTDLFVLNEDYKIMQSPLYGKKLYVDGDSICYGNGYMGGYGRIIANKYNMTLTNKGVGGGTITSMGATNKVIYGAAMDWDNKKYYLRLSGFDPIANKTVEGFAYPVTKQQYETGFGVYPTTYKVVNGVITEQEYSETMPTGTFFVKFEVPTYDGNTVTKYYRMWSANNWLWEAYNSGFAGVHESGSAEIATARHWLSTSVNDVSAEADYVLFEGGINDYLMNRPIGELTGDMVSPVDITTVTGGMEYICRTLLTKCKGKKIMYIITPKAKNYAHLPNSNAAGNKTWADYHDAILKVLRKYSIPCVDLFNNSTFNTELESYLVYTKDNDGVHPTEEGYNLFYVPQIVSVMESGVGNGINSKVTEDMLPATLIEKITNITETNEQILGANITLENVLNGTESDA